MPEVTGSCWISQSQNCVFFSELFAWTPALATREGKKGRLLGEITVPCIFLGSELLAPVGGATEFDRARNWLVRLSIVDKLITDRGGARTLVRRL